MDVARLPGDSSLALLREGYLFGHRRFERLGTDAFRTRLMARPVLLLRGAAAARFFYEDERFTRESAMPRSVLHSLQDEGSVQTLAGGAHRARKALFLEALDGEGEVALTQAFESAWDAASAHRRPGDVERVLESTSETLTRAVLAWLGISATSDDVRARTGEMTAMIDGAGSFAWRNGRGRALRRRSEAWARGVVTRASPTSSRPLRIIADAGLDPDTAAVELLNLVRPTVAVARFIAFGALALHRHPEWREPVVRDDTMLAAFCDEVRRTTPLFPIVGGTAARGLEWREARIAPGDWVVLDLFATNRHPREWHEAWRFDPAQQLPETDAAPGELPPLPVGHPAVVPQGAGPMETGHRCPGEPATRSLLAVAVRRLAEEAWSVPNQDLRVDLSRLPARPGAPGITVRWEAPR
ncbi:cytochrome P450 [Microbacterium sp. AZCO]|uniref:cytochrome P450 n=1 Tax=Microbacterium sp. AZCO TaxID=3142976 RepID=UPI0031F37A77